MDVRKQSLLAASVAGLLAAGVMAVGTAQADHHEGDGSTVPCYGINKCKGTGDCGGKAHSCAGQNECAAHGFIKLDKETCLKIKGGSLTPVES